MGFFIFKYVKTVGGYPERILSHYREGNVFNLSCVRPSVIRLIQKS